MADRKTGRLLRAGMAPGEMVRRGTDRPAAGREGTALLRQLRVDTTHLIVRASADL